MSAPLVYEGHKPKAKGPANAKSYIRKPILGGQQAVSRAITKKPSGWLTGIADLPERSAESAESSRTEKWFPKPNFLSVEPQVAYLHPPFEMHANTTHFKLTRVAREDVSFCVKVRHSDNLVVIVRPQSGVIYKNERSIVIKVILDPVKDERTLRRISKGKEDFEILVVTARTKEINCRAIRWWDKVEDLNLTTEECKRAVVMVKPAEERGPNEMRSAADRARSVTAKNFISKDQDGHVMRGPLSGLSKFQAPKLRAAASQEEVRNSPDLGKEDKATREELKRSSPDGGSDASKKSDRRRKHNQQAAPQKKSLHSNGGVSHSVEKTNDPQREALVTSNRLKPGKGPSLNSTFLEMEPANAKCESKRTESCSSHSAYFSAGCPVVAPTDDSFSYGNPALEKHCRDRHMLPRDETTEEDLMPLEVQETFTQKLSPGNFPGEGNHLERNTFEPQHMGEPQHLSRLQNVGGPQPPFWPEFLQEREFADIDLQLKADLSQVWLENEGRARQSEEWSKLQNRPDHTALSPRQSSASRAPNVKRENRFPASPTPSNRMSNAMSQRNMKIGFGDRVPDLPQVQDVAKNIAAPSWLYSSTDFSKDMMTPGPVLENNIDVGKSATGDNFGASSDEGLELAFQSALSHLPGYDERGDSIDSDLEASHGSSSTSEAGYDADQSCAPVFGTPGDSNPRIGRSYEAEVYDGPHVHEAGVFDTSTEAYGLGNPCGSEVQNSNHDARASVPEARANFQIGADVYGPGVELFHEEAEEYGRDDGGVPVLAPEVGDLSHEAGPGGEVYGQHDDFYHQQPYMNEVESHGLDLNFNMANSYTVEWVKNSPTPTKSVCSSRGSCLTSQSQFPQSQFPLTEGPGSVVKTSSPTHSVVVSGAACVKPSPGVLSTARRSQASAKNEVKEPQAHASRGEGVKLGQYLPSVRKWEELLDMVDVKNWDAKRAEKMAEKSVAAAFKKHSSHNARFQTLFQDTKSAMAKVDQALGAIARDVERTREYAARDRLTASLYDGSAMLDSQE